MEVSMATRWVNFAEIREKVSLEDVLFRYYHVEGLTKTGDKLVGSCPVHGGDNPRAFHADLEKNIWHCFSKCRGGGNQLDLVVKREDVSVRDAALRLQAFFLGDGDSEAPKAQRKPASEQAKPSLSALAGNPAPKPTTCKQGRQAGGAKKHNPPLALTLQLAHDYPHLLEDRGLALETCQHFDVGYCRRGMMRSCIAFPIHNEDGELVAYAGRRLKPQEAKTYGKYKLPKGFHKQLVLYNLHRAKAEIAEHGLILVEGFFAVLKLYEAGFKNVVACMGTELSIEQITLIERIAPKDIYILFDGDDAGREGAFDIANRLASVVPVHLADLPDGLGPDDLSPEHLAWLIDGLTRLKCSHIAFELAPWQSPASSKNS